MLIDRLHPAGRVRRVIGRENARRRLHGRLDESPPAIDLRHRVRGGIQVRFDEGGALLHAQRLADLCLRQRRPSRHVDAADRVPRTLCDIEDDRQLRVLLSPREWRLRILVPTTTEIVFNGQAPVLEELFGHRRLGAHRHEPLLLGFREPIPGKGDLHPRPASEHDGHHDAIGLELRGSGLG